jgi:hypothetical protein
MLSVFRIMLSINCAHCTFYLAIRASGDPAQGAGCVPETVHPSTPCAGAPPKPWCALTHSRVSEVHRASDVCLMGVRTRVRAMRTVCTAHQK